MKRPHPLLVLLALCLMFIARGALAQWPERPVKLIVPYVAGAMGDLVSRLVSEGLRTELGQPFLIDNRPGAGGNIGARMAEQAAADGYTFLVAPTNNLVINQFLYKDLGFDPLKRFDPVTIMVNVPSVLFVNTATPTRTFQEFTAWARANPGKANYGSPGSGTPPHLSAESINKAFGLGMTHIPFNGASKVVAALLANDIQFYLGGVGLGLAHVKAGRLRAIAVAQPSRNELLPDTPTFDEAGLRGISANTWWGLVAPHGTPPAVLGRMQASVCKVIADKGVRARLVQLGNIPICNTPAEMARQLEEEAAFWQRSLPGLGVKAD